MDNNISAEDYKEIPQSRFPLFTPERAREIADEICGMMGYAPDDCELFIELLLGVMNDANHKSTWAAIHEAYVYTRNYDKNFNNWLKGKEGGAEDETIN